MLECLSNWNVTVHRLRSAFVGAVVETKRLNGISFVKVGESGDYTRWERHWNNRKNKVALVLAPNGFLCHLDLLKWCDVQLDDFRADHAYGWYCLTDCSTRMENAIQSDLQSCLRRPVERDATSALRTVVQFMGMGDVERSTEIDDALLVCSSAYDYQVSQPAISRLLASLLIRHIGDIDNTFVLQDLPFLCGRLGLLPECRLIIAHLIQARSDMEATTWCNIGSVLTDNVREHEAAMICFREAIRKDPDLWQPRKNVWHAGRRLMHKHFVKSDFDAAAKLADEVLELGDVGSAPHGFFSYRGLALEMLNRPEEANEAYECALSVDPDCPTAEAGRNRVLDPSKRNEGQWAVQRLIESAAFSEWITEERYPWC